MRFCTKYALENCADDLHYFENEYPQGEKGLQERLRNVAENDFARITYTEAVALLQDAIAKKEAQFLVYPQWGDDLGSEHERYITEKVCIDLTFSRICVSNISFTFRCSRSQPLLLTIQKALKHFT